MQTLQCRMLASQQLSCYPCAVLPGISTRHAVHAGISNRLIELQAVSSRASTLSESSSGPTPTVNSSHWGELINAAPARTSRGAGSSLQHSAASQHSRSSVNGISRENSSWYTAGDPKSLRASRRRTLSPREGTSGDRTSRSSGKGDGSRPAPEHSSNGGTTSSWGRDRAAHPAAGSSVREDSSSNSSSSRLAAPYAANTVKRKVDKRAKKVAFLPPGNQPCCYGCGAPLQTKVPAAAGYVLPDKYVLKQKHKQLNQVLCARCSGLCNGAMIPAVQDFTQKAWAQQQAALPQLQQPARQPYQRQTQARAMNSVVVPADSSAGPAAVSAGDESDSSQLELLGKVLITPEQLRDKISEVRSVKAVVVLLVDLLDASGTLMSKVRDMVGNNPIILLGTKMDLLPAGCHPKDVADWLAESATRRKLQIASCHLVSSHTGEGIAAVTAKICRERKGRDVFVVGAANVGKSAFVRAMLKEMSSLTGGNFDAAAMSTSRFLPVESAMPGTTLGLIALKAFETGGTLYDTPGVHLHHRIPHMLTPEELKLLHPRKRLTAFSPPTPLQVTTEQAEKEDLTGFSEGPNSGRYTPGNWYTDPQTGESKPRTVSATYVWGGLVRVDVQGAPPSTSLVFHGPKSMHVYDMPLIASSSDFLYDWELEKDDSSSPELFCQDSVKARGGLVPHSLVVPASPIPTSACLADIAISGLPGWIGIYAPFTKHRIRLIVWVPRGVEVFLRPPLPCPAPRRLKGSEEGPELAEIGGVLDASEADQEWQAHKGSLGLERMSAEDEEVVKLLLFGDEAAGLQGIADSLSDDQDITSASDDGDIYTGRQLSRVEDPALEAVEDEGSRAALQKLVHGVPVDKLVGGHKRSNKAGSSADSNAIGSSVVDDSSASTSSGRVRARKAAAVAHDSEFGDIYVDHGDGSAAAANGHNGVGGKWGELSTQKGQEQLFTSDSTAAAAAAGSVQKRRRRQMSSR